MMPPRQPRRRVASSAGGSRFSSTRSLEIEEYTGRASPAVVRRFLVLFDIEVEAPVRPDPLPPGTADGTHGKIEEHIERGRLRVRWPDYLVAFAAPLIAEGNEVFLLVTMAGRAALGGGG